MKVCAICEKPAASPQCVTCGKLDCLEKAFEKGLIPPKREEK